MSNFQIVDDFEHGIPMTDENMAQFGWVKVVRCRDCLNFTQDELGDYCTLLDFEDTKSMEDKFCAWGKRKYERE